MHDFPQRLWKPQTALKAFRTSGGPERALTMVRGRIDHPELDERVRFWRSAIASTLSVDPERHLLTTFPLMFPFHHGAKLLMEGPSLFLIEAPSTKMAHTPSVLFGDIHARMRSEGTTPEEWGRIFPLLVINESTSYRFEERAGGLSPLRDGSSILKMEARCNDVAVLTVNGSNYAELIEETLADLKQGKRNPSLVMPNEN